MALTKIGSIGINTGIQFAGVTTIATLNGSDAVLSVGGTVNFVSDVSIGGTVSIAGTLTYEDVTNIDSVGLITARNGIIVGSGITLSKDGDIFATGISTFSGATVSGNVKVGTGVTLSPDGDVFFTGIATGNGSGLTALNASNISSGTVPTARLGSGTASSSTFLRGDSTFQTVNTDLVSDTSPQLGGDLDTNSKNITFGDSTGSTVNRLTFGSTNGDLRIYHDGSDSYIQDAGTGDLIIKGSTNLDIVSSGDELKARFATNGAVELYHDNTKHFETVSGGVKVHGTYELDWTGGSSTYWWENSDIASTSSWVATKGGSGGNLVSTLGGTNGLTYTNTDSIFNGHKSLRMSSGGSGGLRASTEGAGTYWNGTEAWSVIAVFEQTGHSGGTSYGDAIFCQNVNDSSDTNNNGSWSVAPYGDHTWGGGYGEQFAYTGDKEPLANMTQPFKGIFMYRTYGFEHSELSVNLGGGWFPIELQHSAPSSLGTSFKSISFFNFMQSSSSHNFIGGLAELAYWKGTRIGGKELESLTSYLCNKFQL